VLGLERDAAGYPERLRDLRDAPDVVYLAGALPAGRAVGIVGTRRADALGLAFTERLAQELARAGLVIVSGGAQGVDAAAHRGALAVGGGTVVVHGTALDATYPKTHRELFARVLEGGGAWLSETPSGAPAEAWRFLARNRLIAALSEIVIVVQAPARSGALSTARFARTLGRTVMAVPASPWDGRGEGTLELLAQGEARMCRGAGDVLALLSLPGVPIDPPRARDEPTDPEARRVLSALRDGMRRVDDLVAATGLGAARVQVVLVQLAMRGLARQQSGLWTAT
jgi:DNA processing protein